MLEGAAKWGAFYHSSFFILPSHQENFGIAVIEAMACGKPVIITNQINIWREIKEGDGGFVSEDTQTGIEHLMEKCFSLNEKEIKICGLKARILFTNEFSILPAAKKLLSEIIG
jgi:glycosyltransferase involved in cell wall biosynthesis